MSRVNKKYKIIWHDRYGAAPANTSSFQRAAPRSYKLVPTQKLFSNLFCRLITCIAPSLYHSCFLSKGVPVRAMKVYRGNEGTASRILNIGTRCRWAVNFHAPAALPRERPRYPLNRGLGRVQNRSGRSFHDWTSVVSWTSIVLKLPRDVLDT